MSALHCRIFRMNLLAHVHGRDELAVVVVERVVFHDAERRAASAASARRRRARAPPPLGLMAGVAVGDATNLTWWPRAATCRVPPAFWSQSSGCAPKAMMRSVPLAGAWASGWRRPGLPSTPKPCLSHLTPSS